MQHHGSRNYTLPGNACPKCHGERRRANHLHRSRCGHPPLLLRGHAVCPEESHWRQHQSRDVRRIASSDSDTVNGAGGNSVDPATGSFVQTVTDLSFPGRIPVAVTMTHGYGLSRQCLARSEIVKAIGIRPSGGLGDNSVNLGANHKHVKWQISLWLPFAVASFISLVISKTYLALALFGHNDRPLIALGLLSVILAARIFLYTGVRLLPTMLVIFGLILGQLWLIEFVVTILLLHFRGFAP